MTKQKNNPMLRFPEFKGNWTPSKLSSFLKERVEYPEELLPLYSLTIQKGIVPKTERYERAFLVKDEEKAYKIMQHNDFAFNPMNLRFGALARHKGKDSIAVSKYYNIFYCNEKLNAAFAELYLTEYRRIQYYNKMATGTLEEKKRVHYKEFLKFSFLFPSLNEQDKIATFLSKIDKRIQLLTQKKDRLQQYKKGVMQQLFSQEIRFKKEDGTNYPDWEISKLGELTLKTGKKNKKNIQYPIYSINNKEGFLPQSDQFEGVDSNERGYDIRLYKIIKSNTFAYNPARINVGSIGFSGELNDIIVSSLYVCFQTNDKLDDNYLLSFLDTFDFRKAVLRNAEGGVRSYLFYDNFSLIKIPLPSIPEQKKIADFLSAIDKKITLIEKQIKKTQEYKKGLLQQMFV